MVNKIVTVCKQTVKAFSNTTGFDIFIVMPYSKIME